MPRELFGEANGPEPDDMLVRKHLRIGTLKQFAQIWRQRMYIDWDAQYRIEVFLTRIIKRGI